MVRFENKYGVGVYVTPVDVKSVSPHSAVGFTVIHTKDSFFTVKGGTDEVHGKLFPPPNLTVVEFPEGVRYVDIQPVLEWAVTDGHLVVPPSVKAIARKALGMK